MRLPMVLALATAMTSGCASLELKPTFKSMGEYVAGLDKAIQTKALELQAAPSKEEAGIKVLVNAIPPGLQIRDGVISAKDGFQHRILGKFTVGAQGGFFPAYKQNWRKWVCYPQQPLLLVSLATWALVPLYYPCFSTTARSKDEVIAFSKKVAVAAGGDLVVMSFVGESSKSNDIASGPTGFIIQMDPRLKQETLRATPKKIPDSGLSI